MGNSKTSAGDTKSFDQTQLLIDLHRLTLHHIVAEKAATIMLSSCSRVAARNAVASATICGKRPAMTVGLSRPFVTMQNTASRSAHLPRARQRSCSDTGYLLARHFASHTPREKEHAGTSELDKEERPVVPPTPLPGLSKSPLELDRIPEPAPAPSTIRAAIADFLAAQEVGDVKPPPADLTRVKRLWWQAKQLFIFYWNGLKLVYANFKRAQQLRLGVDDHGWKLTRREQVFLRRVDSDVVKLIPFVSVLLILEEVLPLLVLYAPWLLPSTCILPSQLLRIKTDEEKKRREGLTQLSQTLSFAAVDQLTLHVKDLDRVKLLGICKATNLGTFAPQYLLSRRIVKHLE